MPDPADIVNSSEFARAFFEESNDALLIVRPSDLRIILSNPTSSRLSGWESRHLLETTVDRLLVGDNPESMARLAETCRKTSFLHSDEAYTMRQREGDNLLVNVTVSPLHQDPETLALVVVRDVTERKRLEVALKEANSHLQQTLAQLKVSQSRLIDHEMMRLAEQITGGVAHDLNNALTPAVTFSELLLRRSDLTAEARTGRE